MFKLILHLFTITTTLTLTAFGITTQQEIEGWICKKAGYITAIQQNAYGCPRYIECYSDSYPSFPLETPPPIPQKSENNFLKYGKFNLQMPPFIKVSGNGKNVAQGRQS